MIKFFKDIFTDGIGSAIIGILLLSCIVGVLFILGLIGYRVIDSRGLAEQSTTAVVKYHQYSASYPTTHMVMIGKVMVPQTTITPEEYSIYFAFDDTGAWGSFPKGVYESYVDGEKCNVTYKIGRFSGDIYIASISKLQ